MHAEKYLVVYLQSQQLPVADGNFWKNTVSENKLCCIFVVNAIKELFEVGPTTSVTVRLCVYVFSL